MTAIAHYRDSHRRFVADTAWHQMTVLHDEGLYRHLLFKKPGSSMYWFELITWPWHLTITGDMGTYTFRREEDMFSWFAVDRDINPSSWEEKLQNAGRVTEFAPAKVRANVETDIADHVETYGLEEDQEKRLRTEVQDLIYDQLDGVADNEQEARKAIYDFSYAGLTFEDSWEWELTDYTTHFLWCCWAIRHGIEQYNAAKEAAARASPSPSTRSTAVPPPSTPAKASRPAWPTRLLAYAMRPPRRRWSWRSAATTRRFSPSLETCSGTPRRSPPRRGSSSRPAPPPSHNSASVAIHVQELSRSAGVITGRVKKAARDGDGTLSGDATAVVEAYLEEVVGDIDLLARMHGSSLIEVAEANVAKLASRAERGVLTGDGGDR